MIGSRMVSCGNRNVKLRGRTSSKVRDWVSAINDAGLRPPEGWCHPHRFGSFCSTEGFGERTVVAQWSHHEKLVIVDYRVGFIGGLDLCFGWYDTPSQRWAMCMFSLEKMNMLQLLFSWKVLWRLVIISHLSFNKQGL
ncbi:hypothetical protein IFM89_009091 [Coptis chinensis]|uniref:phospholipase D n=1 Tax=Coptis chinensis TaxID=261450 RepID=A0A835MAF9_9MAGN|nr:hypothetical protein IFM89_009091 [Coptis chinensis]